MAFLSSRLMGKLERFRLDKVDCCGNHVKASFLESLYVRIFRRDKIIHDWGQSSKPEGIMKP
jgi:hypothetical protein